MAHRKTEFDWGEVHAVAVNPETAGKAAKLRKAHVNFINERLDEPISHFRVSALNLGKSNDTIVVSQPGVESQIPKVNHFETEEDEQGPGALVVKFHHFVGDSNASLITFNFPWLTGPGMTTVGDVVRALGALKIDEFTMHEEREGCRSAVDGLVRLFHEGGYIHLLGAHPRMGWTQESPAGKTQAEVDSINQERRAEMMGKWYYKLGGGVNRHMKEGTFNNPLPRGAAFKAWVEQAQPQGSVS